MREYQQCPTCCYSDLEPEGCNACQNNRFAIEERDEALAKWAARLLEVDELVRQLKDLVIEITGNP